MNNNPPPSNPQAAYQALSHLERLNAIRGFGQCAVYENFVVGTVNEEVKTKINDIIHGDIKSIDELVRHFVMIGEVRGLTRLSVLLENEASELNEKIKLTESENAR
jgi:hypothetical protein